MKIATILLTMAFTLTGAFAFDTEVTSQGAFVRFFTESNPEISSHGVFSIRKSVIDCVLCEKSLSKDGFYQVWITSERESAGGVSVKYKFQTYEEAVKFADNVTKVISAIK